MEDLGLTDEQKMEALAQGIADARYYELQHQQRQEETRKKETEFERYRTQCETKLNAILKEGNAHSFLDLCEFFNDTFDYVEPSKRTEKDKIKEEYHEIICNRLNSFSISTKNKENFANIVEDMVENANLFGGIFDSTKPYTGETAINYYRVLKDVRLKVQNNPSLLSEELKQGVLDVLDKHEKSGLWYKIKKLFGKG